MNKAKNNAIKTVVDNAKACNVDGDCIIASKYTKCAGACGVAINKDKEADLKTMLGWVDSNICIPLDYAKQCGYMTPMCMQPNPGCLNQACVYNKK